MPDAGGGPVRRNPLERMPKWLICVPLVLQWLWLGLRHRSFTLPSAANPGITAGGLVGETKCEYFDAMGPLARTSLAPYCALPPQARGSAAAIRAAMAAAGLSFPVVAKPDLGMCGFGVRRISDEPALIRYLAEFPAAQTVLLQQWIADAGEAGVVYARHPREPTGRIIGLALRFPPQVLGDGRSTVAELIAADPRAGRAQQAGHEITVDCSRVPAVGERVQLAMIGSTRVGGLYRDGSACITPELTAAIDAIAQDMHSFHFGRFDLRFPDLQALREGRGLRVMEVNGAGSEAIQAWDPDLGAAQAFGMIFAKQRVLFEIAAANRVRGHRPIGLARLARLHRMQQRLLDAYPQSN